MMLIGLSGCGKVKKLAGSRNVGKQEYAFYGICVDYVDRFR